MIAELRSIDWRLPGCGERCWLGRHDAGSHETHGYLLGRMVSSTPTPTGIVRTGCLTVNMDTRTAYVHGKRSLITPTEWRILAHMAQRIGRVCTLQEILTGVWGPEWIDYRRMLRTNIDRLRQGLGDARPLVVTAPDFGYRLIVVEPCGCAIEPDEIGLPGSWARWWNRCRECQTATIPHGAHGLCTRCYRRRWWQDKKAATP